MPTERCLHPSRRPTRRHAFRDWGCRHACLVALLILGAGVAADAQQVADTTYSPPIDAPEYEPGRGPTVAIDAAHVNFHTADDRYAPLAKLLTRDGYKVESNDQQFTASTLSRFDILVIANAMHEQSADGFAPLPSLSAFTGAEIAALEACRVDPGVDVTPLLVVPEGYALLLPEVAWEFSESTPRIAAVHLLQGIAVRHGRGRIAAFGEAAMFTAQLAGPQRLPMGMNEPAAGQNHLFALNLFHWLSGIVD